MTKNYDQNSKNSIVKMVNDGGNPKDLAEEYGLIIKLSLIGLKNLKKVIHQKVN
ncbi:hypothetical protein ACVQ8P_06105 [Dellaglioa sp. BT-FLS60]